MTQATTTTNLNATNNNTQKDYIYIGITIGSFLLNCLFTFWLGNNGTFGDDNGTISKRYQALITPSGLAFSIWGFIYLFETMLTVYCFFESNKIKAYTQYWFISANIMQTLWTPFFSAELINVAFCFMMGIFISLAGCVYTLYLTKQNLTEKMSLKDFWLIQFGITLHFGWIAAAAILNLNIIFVAADVSKSMLLSVSIISFIILTILTNFMGYSKIKFYELHHAPGDVVFPLVTAWATYNIYTSASNPIDEIMSWAPELVTEAIAQTALILSCYSLFIVVYTLIINFTSPSSSSTRGNEGDHSAPLISA